MSESRIKQMKRIARIFESAAICDSDSEGIRIVEEAKNI